MGTRQVVFVGVVASLGRVSLVQGNTLMIVIDLHDAFGIMDQGLLADVPVRDTVIAFIRGKVDIAHLLDFRPSIIFYLIRFYWQWLRSEEHTSELQSRPHLVC